MKIKKYVNLLLTPLKIEIICIAIEMEVFDLLKDYTSLKEIIRDLELDKKNTKIFLDSLVYLKLLKNKNNKYKNSSFSNKYFVNSSDYYFGDMFLFKKEFFEENKKQILPLLKEGNKKQILQTNQKQWAEISKKYFFQEQKTILADFIVNLVRKINSDNHIKNILDLGCSSGVLSLEVVKQNKDIQATLFDFKEVICETKKNIKNYNLTNRVNTLDGDILKDDIKSDYDLILCSNILHLLPQKQKVLKKIYDSLNKNGTLLIVQSYNIKESLKNKENYFYNILPMMLGKEPLDTYEFSNMILNSGFKSVNNFINQNQYHADIKVFIAKK